MSTLMTFWWGCAGSLAIEVVKLNRSAERSPLQLPNRYFKWQFYVSKLLLAAIGGLLAYAYQIHNPALAMNIGASASLIFQVRSRGKSHS